MPGTGLLFQEEAGDWFGLIGRAVENGTRQGEHTRPFPTMPEHPDFNFPWP